MAFRAIPALILAVTPVAFGPAPEGVLPLPTRADVKTQSVLPTPGRFPNRIPANDGTISDAELVTVDLRGDGSPQTVVVDQTITLGGVGDYTLEIPGPAGAVEELPGSEGAPGLRNGSVIWEGFCPGRRTLRAKVTMDLSVERFTPLPIEIHRVDNRIRITNVTAQPELVGDVDVQPAALASAVASTLSALEHGQAPVPGQGGLPRSIPTLGPIDTHAQNVIVPVHVKGDVGSVHLDQIVEGDPVEISAPPDAAARFSVVPVLPSPTALPAPPAAGGMSSAQALQRVLWQVARKTGEGYLGVPIDGPVDVTYQFEPARVTKAMAPHHSAPRGPRPVPIFIGSIGILAAMAGGRRWWLAH